MLSALTVAESACAYKHIMRSTFLIDSDTAMRPHTMSSPLYISEPIRIINAESDHRFALMETRLSIHVTHWRVWLVALQGITNRTPWCHMSCHQGPR